MKIINPKESDKILQSYLTEIKNNDDAIKQFLYFFKEYKIKQKTVHEEEDMMLFQYGNNDWQDGKGEEFCFDLTRQFEIPNEDEFLQLGLTLYYNSEQIGEIKSFNIWSTESQSLDDWETQIKNSEGYKSSKYLVPKRYEIELKVT